MRTNHNILIVDDDASLRKTLSDILYAKEYRPVAVGRGEEALERIQEETPAVALIDLRLEDMSGLDVMHEIKQCSPDTECIVLTGYASRESAIEAVNLGAYSYLQKPYDVEQLLVTIRRALEKREAEEALQASAREWQTTFDAINDAVSLINVQGTILRCNQAMGKLLGRPPGEIVGQRCCELVHGTSERIRGCPLMRMRESGRRESLVLPLDERWFEVRVDPLLDEAGSLVGAVHIISDITDRRRAERELRRSHAQLKRTFEGTVEVLVSAIEMRDPYTAGHQRRVAQLACAIANEMGLSNGQIDGIRVAGLIHDIGKISVPAEILSKPGGLNGLEYGLIQTHPKIGYDVLKSIDFPWPVAQIVMQHHERMDGSGYPEGLPGEEIIPEARILSVADVVEAMASHRPYRPPRGLDQALEEISQNRGILYDPEVVEVCLKLFTEQGFEFKSG